MKCFIFPVIFLFFPFGLCFAQNHISGYVYDRETGEPLTGVSVYTDIQNSGTLTNHAGYFYLNIQKHDTTSVHFSYIGYQTRSRSLERIQNRQTVIFLDKKDYSLGEVTISNENSKPSIAGNMALSTAQIRQLPSLTGDPDILKAFQLLSGVQQGTEGTAGLIVRGGSNDQNLYLLDDVPLYYIYHLGGFASVFDVSAVKQANLYKGFFPASYGDRLSSVLDVRLNDGNLYESKKEFMLGTLVSKLFFEGPFRDEKTTYMISARYCNLGLFTMLTDDFFYTFYDVNAKLSHRIDDSNRLYFTLYSGADRIQSGYKDKHGNRDARYSVTDNFGDNMANIRWFHIVNPFCSSNTLISWSGFHHANTRRSQYKDQIYVDQGNGYGTVEETDTESREKLASSMNDIQIKSNIDFLKFTGHVIKGGAVISFQQFSPQIHSFLQKSKDTRIDTIRRYTVDAVQSAVHLEDDWAVHKNFHLQAGLRVSSFAVGNKKNYWNMEPRINGKLFFSKDLSLCLGYSRMSQSIHLISNNDMGIPKDLWVPSTPAIAPEKSNQYDVEMVWKINPACKLTVSAYYKQMSNLIDLKSSISSTEYWEDAIESHGKGTNKGIELLLEKEKGRLTGYVSYVLSKSIRQFENINSGQPYPFKYDYPHQVNIVTHYQLSDRLQLTAAWTYHSGYAIDMAFEKYSLIESGVYYEQQYGDVHIYKGKNGFRMPAYHRLDIGLTVKKERSEWHLGVYNAYNRKNPYYYYIVNNGDQSVLMQKTMFPVLPSVSYAYFF